MTTAELAAEDFGALLDRAVSAFAEDASYAVAIATEAISLAKRKATGSVRSDLRTAEKRARELCGQAGEFECYTQSPCGTGSCKFAQGDLTLLRVPHCVGKTARPQKDSTGGAYSIEHAVGPLGLMRVATEE